MCCVFWRPIRGIHTLPNTSQDGHRRNWFPRQFWSNGSIMIRFDSMASSISRSDKNHAYFLKKSKMLFVIPFRFSDPASHHFIFGAQCICVAFIIGNGIEHDFREMKRGTHHTVLLRL